MNNQPEWIGKFPPNFGTQTRLKPCNEWCVDENKAEIKGLLGKMFKSVRAKAGKYRKAPVELFMLNRDGAFIDDDTGAARQVQSCINDAVSDVLKLFPKSPEVGDLAYFTNLKRDFVFMQMDKGKGRMVFMCPVKYGELVNAFRQGEDHEPLSKEKKEKSNWDFYSLRSKLKDKRFVWKMPNVHKHEFGVLCLWPKKKNWEITVDKNGQQHWNLIKSWNDLKCRPLVSYHEHYYNKILSTAGQALVGMAREMQGAFHVDKPQDILTRFHSFGEK